MREYNIGIRYMVVDRRVERNQDFRDHLALRDASLLATLSKWHGPIHSFSEWPEPFVPMLRFRLAGQFPILRGVEVHLCFRRLFRHTADLYASMSLKGYGRLSCYAR
jgi:hypothetical protein